MKIQSPFPPHRWARPGVLNPPDKPVSTVLKDRVDIDFRPNPSAIIALIAGPTFGLAAARALGLSNPAGLALAGLAGAVAGYTLFAALGDH